MKAQITERVAFLDNIRLLMIVLVVMHHAAAAYAAIAPHWMIHDTTTLVADIIRQLLDVFMMPVLFFIAGYLILPSLRKKESVAAFLKDKARRLLVPWALAVLIILPLLLYDQPVKPVAPFRSYWLWYLGSFEVRLRPTQIPAGPTTQAIYWYLSLLFAFFVVAALVYALARRGRALVAATRAVDSPRVVLLALGAFGLLTSIGHFLLLLLVPDSSWFTLHMLLEFQVTRLVPYAGCFALGIYAQSRGWLAGGKPLGSLALWAGLSAVLTAAYLVLGWPLLADTGAAILPAGLLLAYAFIRSFLVVSLLVLILSWGARYWNGPSGLNRQLAAMSYNIYLVHLFVVVALQMALLGWEGGPALGKLAIVGAAGLVVSYALSRWVLARHSRIVVVGLLALFVFCLAVRP